MSITTFVRVDCVSLQPLLPQDQPDPIFKAHPELLLDRGVVAQNIDAWLQSQIDQGGKRDGSA
jgi:hypothetical protein